MTRTRTVLIVDDDTYACMAVETLLVRDARTRVFGCVQSPDEAILAISSSSKSPDVILLDLTFDGDAEAGLRAIPDLRAVSPESALLMMSVSHESDVALNAIKSGADGFVCKAESGEAIANAALKAAEGYCVLSESIAREVVQRIAEVKQHVVFRHEADRSTLELTIRMWRTVYLYCICRLSAKEIADEECISVHTVNTRIRDAYRVIGATNRDHAFMLMTASEHEQR